MIETYEKYLEILHNRMLQKFFAQQKEYVFCKLGCSHCCEKGQYPFSELEFKYTMMGYNNLSNEDKMIIDEQIREVKTEQVNYSGDNFMYRCPFLINKMCSIYKYRGIICRTHGLMFYYKNKDGETKNKAPHCIDIGLNYSNVYDTKTQTISDDLWRKSGIETEPVAYNLSLTFLLDNILTRELKLEFGAEKTLIDWFD